MCQVYRDTTVKLTRVSPLLCSARLKTTFKKCFFETFFHSVFFSKIKIYFTVMLTTSNQKFLNFFSWLVRKSFSPNPTKSLIYFCLLSTRFRDIKFHFLKKKIIVFRQLFFFKLFQLRFQSC